MKRAPKVCLMVAMALMGCCVLTGQRAKSIHKLGERVETVAEMSDFTTVADDSAKVKFYGYEKTLRANKETVFVKNLGRRTLYGLVFTVSYRDADGRELHQRQVRTPVEIPPGGVRRVDYPSWDTQHTFYFADSPAPRVPAIPYTVKINSDSIIVVIE